MSMILNLKIEKIRMDILDKIETKLEHKNKSEMEEAQEFLKSKDSSVPESKRSDKPDKRLDNVAT